jgi:AcrR family transcriptional regulator
MGVIEPAVIKAREEKRTASASPDENNDKQRQDCFAAMHEGVAKFFKHSFCLSCALNLNSVQIMGCRFEHCQVSGDTYGVSLSNTSLSKRANRKSYHHGDLEAALIEAAIELVRKNGPDHLSLRAAADQVGVSPSAVYHYFPDKDSLIKGIVQKLFLDLAMMQKAALSQIAGKSARAAKLRYRELGRTYFRWASMEPNLFRLMSGGFCKVALQEGHKNNEAFLMLTSCLDDLLALGVISPEMRPYGELISWTGVHGASNLIVEGHLPAQAFEELLEGLELAMKGGKR